MGEQPYLLADIPVVGSIVPTFFLSKAEIANWPVIGWMATTAHTLFIQRGSGDTSKISEQMREFLSQRLTRGFPRSDDHRRHSD